MIIDTSHLLVAVNSAANFFIYYLLRKNFRDAVWKLLTCKNTDADRDRTNPLNSTANIQHCRSVMVHTTRTGLSTCDKGYNNIWYIISYTIVSYYFRRHFVHMWTFEGGLIPWAN